MNYSQSLSNELSNLIELRGRDLTEKQSNRFIDVRINELYTLNLYKYNNYNMNYEVEIYNTVCGMYTIGQIQITMNPFMSIPPLPNPSPVFPAIRNIENNYPGL